MKAIPRILVRIDRGEDWVEICGDWNGPIPPVCGSGELDWLDYGKFQEEWQKLSKAVME